MGVSIVLNPVVYGIGAKPERIGYVRELVKVVGREYGDLAIFVSASPHVLGV